MKRYIVTVSYLAEVQANSTDEALDAAWDMEFPNYVADSLEVSSPELSEEEMSHLYE